MGYKILGYVVWRGAKWYMRRHYEDAPRKLAIAGAAGAVVAGAAVAAVAAQRSRSNSD